MEIMRLIIQILLAVPGCLAALLSILFFIHLRWPAPVLWFLKLYTSALSRFLVFIGILCILTGLATGSVFLSLVGTYVTLAFYIHVLSVTGPPVFSGSFEHAFGMHWEDRVDPGLKKHFLPSRNPFRLPAVPDPRLEQNLPFAEIPGTDRQLLCDLWQPSENVRQSGLTFIYLHGSAFYFLDKDFSTRPLFRYLSAQGHVIMDVAYRLAPETDIMGMVHDVNRAVAWMKDHAGAYGINPDCVVVGGGSAGGHLAMLAAYSGSDPQFRPGELQGKDISVAAVVSLYGTSDLEEVYYHTNQHLTTRSIPGRPKKAVPTKMPGWLIKSMGKDYHRLGMDKGFENAGALAPILGGHPDECPETYALFSPVTHVHPGCPPTLLIHGEHDIMAPVKSSRVLHSLLQKENVPSVLHILPQTDHAFDLILPEISPSAHNAIYDVERFLAICLEEKLNMNNVEHAKPISR
jgi:acetyl esterase/lipase